MEIESLAVLIPFVLNMILLYNRKLKWAQGRYKWITIFVMLSTGLVLLLLKNMLILDVPFIISWGLMTPMIFSIVDLVFKNLSKAIHNRDLYLWLKGSTDIDDSKLSGGNHVRASDRLFSMIMLFLVLFLPFIGMLILK